MKLDLVLWVQLMERSLLRGEQVFVRKVYVNDLQSRQDMPDLLEAGAYIYILLVFEFGETQLGNPYSTYSLVIEAFNLSFFSLSVPAGFEGSVEPLLSFCSSFFISACNPCICIHSIRSSRLISNNMATRSFSRTSDPGLNGEARLFPEFPAFCDPGGKLGVCGVNIVDEFAPP